MAKSSTDNINSTKSSSISWHNLRMASFGFAQAFPLALPDDSVVYCEEVVRILPKRRLVSFGEWQGKPVVVKLFYDRRAKQHLERDMIGIKKLVDNSVPAPKIYYDGPARDKRIWVLIFERILEAVSLEQIWQNKVSVEACEPELKAMTMELATQHVYGILQHDLHLKNFLVKGPTIYTLDGAQIEVIPEPLGKKDSINNLALFFSHLGVGSMSLINRLFKFYAESRGWLLKKDDLPKLHEEIKAWQTHRWEKFQRKIFRSCTDFVKSKKMGTYSMHDRHYESPQFFELMQNPEKMFADPEVKMLKSGGSSTVIEVMIQNRRFVIKRYNMKSVGHWLRRFFRTTRAEKSWLAAHKLRFFDIATARPVAFIEKNVLGMRHKSYFITEYVDGERADQFFVNHSLHSTEFFPVAERVINAISDIAKINMTHGDLKITNIIIDRLQRPVLIDLDGVRYHNSANSLHRTVHKELKRFLENFRERPAVYNALVRILKQ